MNYNDWGYLDSQSRNDQALVGDMSYGYDSRGRMRTFTLKGRPLRIHTTMLETWPASPELLLPDSHFTLEGRVLRG